MPVRIVANGVVTRSVRDTAAFFREAERVWRNPKLPPIGDVTRPGKQRLRIARAAPKSVVRECESGGARADPEDGRRCSRSSATTSTRSTTPVPARFIDDFLLYWALLAFAIVRGGRRTFGPSFDRDQAGQPHPRASTHAPPQPAPAAGGDRAAVGAAAASPRGLSATYDVVLTPTLADETPRIGHLDPTADYEQIMDRLIDWVAFTPLQNATGDPAISLPLARVGSRPAGGHDVLSPVWAARHGCWSWPTSSKRPGPGRASTRSRSLLN